MEEQRWELETDTEPDGKTPTAYILDLNSDNHDLIMAAEMTQDPEIDQLRLEQITLAAKAPDLQREVALLRKEVERRGWEITALGTRLYDTRMIWCDECTEEQMDRAQEMAEASGCRVCVNVHGVTNFTAWPKRVPQLEKRVKELEEACNIFESGSLELCEIQELLVEAMGAIGTPSKLLRDLIKERDKLKAEKAAPEPDRKLEHTLFALGFAQNGTPFTALSVDANNHVTGWDIDWIAIGDDVAEQWVKRFAAGLGPLRGTGGCDVYFADMPATYWLREGYELREPQVPIVPAPAEYTELWFDQLPEVNTFNDKLIWEG